MTEMLTDHDLLLRAVLEAPADDAPRLVYADWLEENRQEERAEFIRDCCNILAKHTDCPIRLRDVSAGRPVPLRCGYCAYCVARQRGTRFYSRHPWIVGVDYAVAFEPTPLDGEMPTSTISLTAVVRRGFVDEIYLPLSDFMRDAKTLFSTHPITRVRLTDREPWTWGPNYVRPWLDVGMAGLPGVILKETTDWYYPTIQSAHAALSDACVRYGRKLAGLSPLDPDRR